MDIVSRDCLWRFNFSVLFSPNVEYKKTKTKKNSLSGWIQVMEIISIIVHRRNRFIIYSVNENDNRRMALCEPSTKNAFSFVFIDSDKNENEIKFQTSIQILILLW